MGNKFDAAETVSIVCRLRGNAVKWGMNSQKDRVRILMDLPSMQVEVQLLFDKRQICILCQKILGGRDPLIYEVVFSDIESIHYNTWEGDGPGIEFRKKNSTNFLRIFASGKVRVEV